MPQLFRLIGAIGMILIIIGIAKKNRMHSNVLFAVGGVLLLIYSIYLKDPIFVPLQIAFTLASIRQIYLLTRK